MSGDTRIKLGSVSWSHFELFCANTTAVLLRHCSEKLEFVQRNLGRASANRGRKACSGSDQTCADSSFALKSVVFLTGALLGCAFAALLFLRDRRKRRLLQMTERSPLVITRPDGSEPVYMGL